MSTGNSLKPRKELEEAFKRCTADIEFRDAHLELATESTRSAVIDLLKNHFYTDETLCKSLSIVFDEELYQVWWNTMSDDLSVVLVSDKTGEVIGARVIGINKRNEQFDPSKYSNREYVKICQFLQHKSDEMDVFKKYNTDIAIHFLALCVHKEYRGQGAATKLMKAALAFSKELGLEPACITGEGTSESSQWIYNKFGFETLHTIYYKDYKVDDEVVFSNTGNNLSTKIYVKRL